MADARRQDMAIRAFEKKSIQAEGRGLGPAEQLLFDLQILRDEERDERRADEERQTLMEQRAMAQYSAEVADVRRDAGSQGGEEGCDMAPALRRQRRGIDR